MAGIDGNGEIPREGLSERFPAEGREPRSHRQEVSLPMKPIHRQFALKAGLPRSTLCNPAWATYLQNSDRLRFDSEIRPPKEKATGEGGKLFLG